MELRIDTTCFSFGLYNPLYWRFNPLLALRYFWQRRTRGFDDSELWSLDWTISKFILPRLKAFREVGKHGCSVEFLPEDISGEYTDADIDAGLEKLYAAIDKMIYAFECKVNDDTDLPAFTYEPDPEHWLGKRITNFDEYLVAQKAREVKIQEGLQLFAKYMHCLWD